jgi:hypothetical protein
LGLGLSKGGEEIERNVDLESFRRKLSFGKPAARPARGSLSHRCIGLLEPRDFMESLDIVGWGTGNGAN